MAVSKNYKFNFIELMEQETKLSIIMILKVYNSLNLRQISAVLGISEPSTHAHIVDLLDNEMIVLDPAMAGKRGKYYKIAPNLDEFLEQGEQEFESYSQDHGDIDYYKNMSTGLRTLGIVTQRFGIYSANYVKENAEKLSEIYKEQKKVNEKRPSLISGNLSFLNLKSQEEVDSIKSKFDEFIQLIQEVSDGNKNLTPDETHEVILISGLIVPLLKLDPREDLSKD